MRVALSSFLLASLLSCYPAFAQSNQSQTPPREISANAGTYKLTFVVREFTAGKLSGTRTYSALFDTGRKDVEGELRAGNRIPIKTGEGANLQYQYIDAGVNFDFRSEKPATEANTPKADELKLHIKAEISSAASSSEESGTLPGLRATELVPIIRQDRWESGFTIKLNTPTLLFSSEDPTVDRKTQVELTVKRAD